MYKQINDSSQLIVITEGLDCSSKTTLAKKIAFQFKLDFIDTDYFAQEFKDFKGNDWKSVVNGINLVTAQFFKSISNVVKPRYSLSERVYSEYYNRKSAIDPVDLELAAIDKLVLIYIDIEYDFYLNLMQTKRFDEEPFTKEEFDKQRTLFLKAFDDSLILNKIIIKNDSTLENLFNKAVDFVNRVKEDKLNTVNLNILKCDKCPLMLDSCRQVNQNYARPILPNNNFLKGNIEYMFIGIAPGRGNNTPYSIKAFSHTSGSILHKILEEYEILDKTYFTNVVKCNTPKDGKFSNYTLSNCTNYLRNEILIIDPKKIFVLGSNAKKYVEMYLDNILTLNQKRFVFVKHPSHLVYNRTEQALLEYKESIKNNLLQYGTVS